MKCKPLSSEMTLKRKSTSIGRMEADLSIGAMRSTLTLDSHMVTSPDQADPLGVSAFPPGSVLSADDMQ